MEPIRKPELLDPGRAKTDEREQMTLEEHRDRARLLDQALRESCAYAEQLWDDLDGVRGYLMGSLPPDPRAPGAHATASAAPTGPDDETGWDAWIATFAEVTSVLAGPHGDSGYGLGEARRAADVRRTAQVTNLAARRPEAMADITGTGGEASPPTPADTAAVTSVSQQALALNKAHTGLTIVLGVLALRGLRRRHESQTVSSHDLS